MLRAVKLLSSAAVGILAVTGLYWLCLRPYLCNRVTDASRRQTLAAWEVAERLPESSRTVAQARLRLARMEVCIDACSASAELYVVAAANLRLLKQYERAADYYRAALRYGHRPDIYYNLGITELAAGDRERAIEHLVLAGRTGSYWNLIENETVRSEVTRRLFYEPAPRF